MSAGVLFLSGPPASGKDAVTEALGSLDSRYRLFPKLKSGSGRTAGYRFKTREELEEMDRSGAIVQRHMRYGNVYAVDRPKLEQMISDGLRPVIHVGRVENLRVLRAAGFNALSVLIWASRVTARERLRERRSTDIDDRLIAWDEERADLAQPLLAALFDLVLLTDREDPLAVAKAIDAAFAGERIGVAEVETALAEIRAS